MATAQEKSEVSDEQLAALLDRAVNARGEKEWREKVEKAGGTLRAGIFVLEGAEKMTGAPECSSLCRTPSIRPGWVSLERGSGFEKHPGDSEAGSDFRFYTTEEAEAAGIVSIDAALRVRENRLTLGKLEAEAEGVRKEKGRTRELVDELQKRIVELEGDERKASARLAEARRPLEALLSPHSPEWQRQALALSEKLEDARARYKAGLRDPQPLPLGKYEIADETGTSPVSTRRSA